MDFVTFEKSEWFDLYVKNPKYKTSWTSHSDISMLDSAGSYLYKLFNFTGINMEVTNAVINIE